MSSVRFDSTTKSHDGSAPLRRSTPRARANAASPHEAKEMTRCDGGVIGKIKHLFSRKHEEVFKLTLPLQVAETHTVKVDVPPLTLAKLFRENSALKETINLEIQELKASLSPHLYPDEKESIHRLISEKSNSMTKLLTPENLETNPSLVDETTHQLEQEINEQLALIQRDIIALQETPRHELRTRTYYEESIMSKNCTIELLENKIRTINTINN